MKSTPVRLLAIVAWTIAFFILSFAAFAQTPTPQKAVTVSSGAPLQAIVIASVSTKDVVVSSSSAVQPVRNEFRPAPAIINFVPADIFGPIDEAGAAVPWQTFPSFVPPAIKKDAPRENQDDTATLAKKLRNPVSSLARIYFDNKIDFGMASNREGYRYTMNLEPVLPIALNENWNLIVRTRIPLISQDGIDASTVQGGLGDILQSFFVSPNNTHPVFWGVGTTLLIPTATDTHLGTGKFGLGPTAVIGAQHRAWTYGVLARHIWSVAGHSDRADVRATYVQPFVSYTTRSAWTFSVDTESTYDWVGKLWSVPITVEVGKVFRVAGHAVSVGGGVTCWAATLPGGPQACGVRFSITPLFPAK